MSTAQLVEQILSKRSFLCIGLDTDLEKIPEHLLVEDDPIFAFNKAIVDATHTLCVAYKPNTAFYEAYGTRGWGSLIKTVENDANKGRRQFLILVALFFAPVIIALVVWNYVSEHGVGTTKAPYIKKELGEKELMIMKKIKVTFDPNGILNPGKIFNSSKN